MNCPGSNYWYSLPKLWRHGRGIVAFALTGCAAATPSGRAATQMTDQPSATATALVFEDVTVVDVEQGQLIPSQRVVIAGNRIQAMGNMKAVQVPKGARIIDARGKYLIPGLWDMHTHSWRGHTLLSSQLLIANGVTGVRDAASEWPLDSMVEWRRQVLAGTRAGPPHQLLSGHSIDEIPINNVRMCVRKTELHTCVADSADAMHVIDSLRTAGADMLKTYSLSDRMYFRIAAKARRAGIPFGGHTKVSAIAASDSGARIIDHSLANEELIERCLYHQASVEKCRPVAERFVRNGTWWVPTWIYPPRVAGRARSRAIYAHFNKFVRDFLADSVSPASKHLHDYLQRGFTTTDLPPAPESISNEFRVPETGSTVDSLGYMYVVKRAGLPVLAGTDCGNKNLIAGFSLHGELATYVAEGMTPLEALQTATLNPAKFLRGTDSLGTVAPGKVADLVLLDADPLVDIINTTAIRAVVANGRYLDRPTLDSLLTEARTNVKQGKSR